ncbi:MAG: hypothetical protein M3N45_10430 [Actinomycetota bacterium]|nr:hypothetical protein [Actinomycetota bacterium]
MLEEGRNGPEPVVKLDESGRTAKVSLEGDVFVFSEGKSLEQKAVSLLGDKEHSFPVNLADTLEEFFESRRGNAGPVYGRLRITIERA